MDAVSTSAFLLKDCSKEVISPRRLFPGVLLSWDLGTLLPQDFVPGKEVLLREQHS